MAAAPPDAAADCPQETGPWTDSRDVAAAYPNLRHAQYSGPLAVVGRRRDAKWGRFLFSPPELINPQVIFDPPPFRATEYSSPTAARPPAHR